MYPAGCRRFHRSIRSCPGAFAGVRSRPCAAPAPATISSVPASATYQPQPSSICPGGSPGRSTIADVQHEADGDDREHGRQLAARPRQLVVAGDDVGEHERRDRDHEQDPAQDACTSQALCVADAGVAVDRRQPADGVIPRREDGAAEQQAAEQRDQLVARQACHQRVESASATSCSSVHGPWPVRRRCSPSCSHASSWTGRSSASASSSGALRYA